jgi:hypothetical protein
VPTWSSHNNSHGVACGGLPLPGNAASRVCLAAARLLCSLVGIFNPQVEGSRRRSRIFGDGLTRLSTVENCPHRSTRRKSSGASPNAFRITASWNSRSTGFPIHENAVAPEFAGLGPSASTRRAPRQNVGALSLHPAPIRHLTQRATPQSRSLEASTRTSA